MITFLIYFQSGVTFPLDALDKILGREGHFSIPVKLSGPGPSHRVASSSTGVRYYL